VRNRWVVPATALRQPAPLHLRHALRKLFPLLPRPAFSKLASHKPAASHEPSTVWSRCSVHFTQHPSMLVQRHFACTFSLSRFAQHKGVASLASSLAVSVPQKAPAADKRAAEQGVRLQTANTDPQSLPASNEPLRIKFHTLPTTDISDSLLSTNELFGVAPMVSLYANHQRQHFLVVMRILELLLLSSRFVGEVTSSPFALQVVCKPQATLEALQAFLASSGFDVADNRYFSVIRDTPAESLGPASILTTSNHTANCMWWEAETVDTQYEPSSQLS